MDTFMSILRGALHVLGVVVVYGLTLALPIIMLLWYRQGQRALMVFILMLTVIGYPIASVMALIAVYQARKAG